MRCPGLVLRNLVMRMECNKRSVTCVTLDTVNSYIHLVLILTFYSESILKVLITGNDNGL